MIEVRVAFQGEGTKAVLQKRLKQPGDSVSAHEPIAEVETDKVTVEVSAPEDGVIFEWLKVEGDDLAPGEVLARLEGRTPNAPPAVECDTQIPRDEATTARIASGLSPAVRRLLEKYGLNAADIPGHGGGGRITVQDVETYVEATRSKSALTPALEEVRPEKTFASSSHSTNEPDTRSRLVPHSPMRRRIAAHLAQSLLQISPHVTSVFEADMSAVLRHRERHKPALEKRGVHLTLTAYFLRACVEAIKAVPELNSRYHDNHLEILPDVNIGIATALGNQGLIVPVLHGAHNLDLLEIALAIQVLVQKARAGRLAPEEVQGGTFTISNHGVSGSLLAAPIIINQPQVAILGVGKVQDRLIVRKDGGLASIQICPMCYVTLTIDHRALDGEQANRFLSSLTGILQDWPDLAPA